MTSSFVDTGVSAICSSGSDIGLVNVAEKTLGHHASIIVPQAEIWRIGLISFLVVM